MRTVNCIGFGQISSGGNNITCFKETLLNEESKIRKLNTSIIRNKKELYCGSVEEIPYEEKFITMAKIAMFEAIENTGLNLNDFYGNYKAGLVFGTSLGNTQEIEQFHKERGANSIALSHSCCIGQKLREVLKVKGTSITLSNTCCTGISAISAASQLIIDGTLDLCVVGCVDMLGELIISGLDSLNVLSKGNVLKPFGANRDGMILGEGAAFLILANEKYTNRKASIDGCSIKNDATHLTAPDRNASGLITAIKESLQLSRISAEEIDIVFCCGNGTVYNDEMQFKAIKEVWGKEQKKCLVTSIKPLIGHTLSVSGIIETIAIILMMQDNVVVSIGEPYEQSQQVDNISLIHKRLNLNFKNAILLSSGFSGVQAAQVIRK